MSERQNKVEDVRQNKSIIEIDASLHAKFIEWLSWKVLWN